MRKAILIALLMISASATAADLPPGKWWRRPDVAQRLSLSADQQTRLDRAFSNAAAELIDRKAEVDKLAVALRAELDQQRLDRTRLQDIAERLTVARGRLFERELMMLVDMREILTDAQWTRLRSELDRRREQQRPMQRRR